MEYANSRIERLKAKVEETDRDFGRLKLRSHSKFNKILQVSGDLRQIEALVEGRDYFTVIKLFLNSLKTLIFFFNL